MFTTAVTGWRQRVRPSYFSRVIVFTLVCVLGWSLTTSPCLANTPGGSCGPADGPDDKEKARCDMGGGKTFVVKCIAGSFLKIEVECGAKTTCFAKCVFPGGQNGFLTDKGPGGQWDKIIWYNWDFLKCGVKPADLAPKRGETTAQHSARIRQFLLDKDCDFNCYTWCRPSDKNEVSLVGGINEEPFDLAIEIARDGGIVDEMHLATSEEVEHAFMSNDFLQADPMMALPTAPQQEFYNLNTMMVDDFEDGIIPDVYTMLPGTNRLDVVNGAMEFDIIASGDGFELDVSKQHVACLALKDLNFGPFKKDHGFAIDLDFGSGDLVELMFFQTNSIKVKAKETRNGVESETVRTVKGIDLEDVKSVEIDWVSNEGGLDYIEIEVYPKVGEMVKLKVLSGFFHEKDRHYAYRMRGIDITYDPLVSIGEVAMSEHHHDTVDGFPYPLDVNELYVEMNSGSGNAFTVGTTGFAGFGIPQRIIDVQVLQGHSKGGLVFNNSFAMVGEKAQSMTLLTDADGMAKVTYQPSKAGPVYVQVTNGDLKEIVVLEVDGAQSCHCDMNLNGMIDEEDEALFMRRHPELVIERPVNKAFDKVEFVSLCNLVYSLECRE